MTNPSGFGQNAVDGLRALALMKTLLRVALGGLLVGSALVASAASVDLMVKYKPNSSPALINAAIGARTIRDLPEIGWQRVRLPASFSADRGVKYFRSLSSVAATEPVMMQRLMRVPNDTGYSQQYAPVRINMPAAWEYTIGNPDVLVGVVDSGVRSTHEDLAANLVSGGRDYYDDDADPTDGFGHGTAVSGCVSAVTNNGKGVAGTGWNVNVYNVKVFPDTEGSSPVDIIAKGIIDATNKGCRIINLSLGGSGASQVQRDAVDAAIARNIIVVASAGNAGTSAPNYPAAWPEVLSVGATDENDVQADFTSFGPTVDVAAPGVEVLTTDRATDNSYAHWSGTSFSAPITSGALALMVSYSPGSPNTELIDALTSTTKNVGTWLQHGLINVGAAMARLRPPIVTDVDPSTANLYEGRIVNPTNNPTTDAAHLDSADSIFIEVASTYKPSQGSLASITANLPVTYDAARIISARLQLDFKATRNVTALVQLYNWNTGAYELYNSYALNTTMRSVDATIQPSVLAKYVKNGQMRILIRTVLPSRLGGSTGSTYHAQFDSVGVRVTQRQP